MPNIFAYQNPGDIAILDQLPLKRDWMDFTFDRHAYHCFPMSLANRMGWGISFKEDIRFIWDGINDSTSSHVKILSGGDYVHPHRGNRTISFNTGLTFKSDENLTLLTMPVPNQFIDGAQCITTLTSTSVMPGELAIAWIVTRPNEEIVIPAGTPVAAILPISLTDLQSFEMIVKSISGLYTQEDNEYMQARGNAAQELNSRGDWTHFYRDAKDHLGNTVGKHEAKKIILKTTEEK
jgi:hypothetical protein